MSWIPGVGHTDAVTPLKPPAATGNSPMLTAAQPIGFSVASYQNAEPFSMPSVIGWTMCFQCTVPSGHESEYIDWFLRAGTHDGNGVPPAQRDAFVAAHTHTIPHCGHIVPLDRPIELLAVLRPFLASADG